MKISAKSKRIRRDGSHNRSEVGLLPHSDRRVLSMLQHRASASAAEISKLTGYSQAKVRYTIDSLLERKIIRKEVYIDVYLLGFSYQTVFFSLLPKAKAHRDKLISYLIKSPQVSYFVELGGEFDFCIDICVKEMMELVDFMRELSSEFGVLFNKKTSSVMVSMFDYPLDLGEGGRKGQPILSCGLSRKRVEIDKLDHLILSTWSKDPTLSLRGLSQSTGVPANTVSYRVDRLEKTHVIRGYRYIPIAHRLGLQSFVHCVSLCGLSEKLRRHLLDFFAECPSVSYVLECSGNWDLEFGTSVYTAHEVIEIVRSFQEQFGEVISTVKTIPLFLYHKASKYPFLHHDD